MEIYIAGIQQDLYRLEQKLVECHVAKESAVLDAERRIFESLRMQRIELTDPTRYSQSIVKSLLTDAKMFHEKMTDKQALLCEALAENDRLKCDLVSTEAEKRKLKDCISRLSLELARLKDTETLIGTFNRKRDSVILDVCNADVFNLIPKSEEQSRVLTEINRLSGPVTQKKPDRLHHSKASFTGNPLPVRNYNFRDD